jgi:predicted DsbA family dithiol-disulfide isomerase
LTTLGSEVGVHDVAALLASDRYAAQVREDEAVALELGISGVPTVLVDRKFMVVGARPAEDIVSVLDRAWQRRDQP